LARPRRLEYRRFMGKEDQLDRRRTTRVPLAIKAVDVESGTAFRTMDLSLDGACLASNEMRPNGSALDLELLLPAGQALRVRGVVTASTEESVHVSFRGLGRMEMLRIAECLF
jgi:hypothetical protein